MPKKYDFAGWVTKNDIRCADGVTIKHGAFLDNDGTKVPLVWQHGHNDPTNVLGYVELHNKPEGVYGFGYFNDTEYAEHANKSVKHGDVTSMSIAAKRIKKRGQDVIHGLIYEVSLVLSPANPGAVILEHSDDADVTEGTSIIYPGDHLIHSSDDIIHEEETTVAAEEKTIGEVLDTLNEEQMDAVEALVANVIQQSYDEEDDDIEHNDYNDMILQEVRELKHNVFDGQGTVTTVGGPTTLTHSDLVDLTTELRAAQKAGRGTFKDVINMDNLISHMDTDGDELRHSITNIEVLFPEATLVNNEPEIYRDENTRAAEIVSGTRKLPYAKLKTRSADFTAEEARARGYIKGNQKIEQVFSLAQRQTTPQTIYKKQKLDRDDIIDITDFNIVNFIWKEMRFMLFEEIGRAILVGDGRPAFLVGGAPNPDKIKEEHIRPILTDDGLYTLKKTFKDETTLVEDVVVGQIDYKGSGSPVGFIDPLLLAKVKLLKGTDGRWLSGHILSDAEVAAQLGLSAVKPTTLMSGKGLLVVNLNDYGVGTDKGGEITTFEDFDIDFNQYKYLIEGRMSGALLKLESAVHYAPEKVVTPPAGE